MTHDEMDKLEGVISRITKCHPVERYCFDQCERTCIEYITPDIVSALIADVKRLTIERDAAIVDLCKTALETIISCDICRYYEVSEYTEQCNSCIRIGNGDTDQWQWRVITGDGNNDG